jgi:hypothetical protein
MFGDLLLSLFAFEVLLLGTAMFYTSSLQCVIILLPRITNTCDFICNF